MKAIKSFTTSYPAIVNLSLLLLAIVLNVAAGAVFISPQAFIRILIDQMPHIELAATWPDYFPTIIFSIRLPHMALMLLTGAALAASGAAYQGLFRNPLADPYLIGVASGAGLGAVAAYSMQLSQRPLGLFFVPVAAFAGALVTILAVYALARVGDVVPLTTLILAGVAVSAFASALTSFLMLRSNEQVIRAISFLLGGAPLAGWRPVVAMLPYILPGLIALAFSGHALNLLQFGEEQAGQMGLSVERTKRRIIIAASLTTAVAVSFAGVIGFIGLIVPHLLRILWGIDYRRLIPLSMLAGGTALLLADMLARSILAPQVIPVGIVTALAGAPFFLWILRRAKQVVFW